MTEETQEEETSKEEQTSQTNEEETSKTPEEKTEDKSKDLQSALAQKEHFRKKAEENEQLLKKLQSEKPNPSENQDEWKSKVEFLLQNQDKKYSEDEFEHIANIATRKGVDLKEAARLEDEYIQFKREKVQKANQTPGPSSGSSKAQKDIEKMSKDEFYEYAKQEEEKNRGGSGV